MMVMAVKWKVQSAAALGVIDTSQKTTSITAKITGIIFKQVKDINVGCLNAMIDRRSWRVGTEGGGRRGRG